MYFLVSLKATKEKTVIPSKWIKGMSYVELFNYGLAYQRKKSYTFFYTNNFDAEPDFTAPLRDSLDGTVNGCYLGTIVKQFENCKNAMVYMMWLRAKMNGNGAVENKIKGFINLSELDDDHIDTIQEIIQDADDLEDILLLDTSTDDDDDDDETVECAIKLENNNNELTLPVEKNSAVREVKIKMHVESSLLMPIIRRLAKKSTNLPQIAQ